MRSIPAVTIVGAVLAAASPPATAKDNKLPDEVVNVLANAETFELLSLDPDSRVDTSKDAFHGYKVLGKTSVKEADARQKLVDSLAKGMEGEIRPAKCFNPRHGIRATHDGKTVELVICFECHQFKVFTGPGKVSGLLVDKSPEPAFDKILKDAGIPKAK
ncbi:MAG TPA: hypothetical protein VKS79_10595 [Gemmataceae bacterium]|nr:hypothetical protein [Gemmataceae bacterium]